MMTKTTTGGCRPR